MFDDLSELDKMDVSEIKNVDSGPSYQQSGNKYGNGGYNGGNQGQRPNNYGGGNSGGGYGGGYGGGGGNPNFKRKEEVVEEPYIPVALFVDRDFPPEIKTSLYNIASRLINKKITVRYNGDDKDFHERISALSDKFVETYIPWKAFNGIENNRHYYNTLTSKHLAQLNFGAWDKISDAVKAMLARNVRMVFGDKNNSVALCVITWSGDGASRPAEITKETGRASFIIKLAGSYGFPVINIGKSNAEAILEKSFGL